MPPDRSDNGPLAAAGTPAVAVGVPGAEPTDRELLAAHVAGDPEAFGQIVGRHRDRLWAVALRTLGDREDAADAVQDALISAYRAAASFRGDAAVTTWLHRIVVNACLDRARSRKSRQTVPLPETGPHEPAEPGDPMEQRDTALVVHRALADLPEDQRAALVLVDLQGHSVADSAQILGVAEGTIKSRCARGRARLAVSLGYLRNPEASSTVQRSRRTTEEGAS